MNIPIDDNKKIQLIQKEFNDLFPYLKIEFFTRLHRTGNPSPKKQMVSSDKLLGDCRLIHNQGTLTITPEMKVDELEQAFRKMYGLSVQVFRKSGEIWLETTLTDSWSLKQQNDQGEMISKYIAEKNKTLNLNED